MNLLRNLFSSLISFFLVPLFIIFVVAYSLFGVFLNSENFKGVLDSHNTYNRLASTVIPSFLINLAENTNSQTSLPAKSLGNVISKIDKKVLAADLEKAVNSTYDFVTTDEKHFETKIDLTTYTTPLAANLKQSVIDYFNSLPACTQAETAALDQNSLGNLNCKPNGLNVTTYLKSLEIDSLVDDIKTGFPTQLIISDQQIATYPQTNLLPDKTSNTDQQTNKTSVLVTVQKSIQSYRIGNQYLLITILFLFVLLAITRVPNIASICKWVSTVLFSASFIPLVGSTLLLYFLKPDFFTGIFNSAIDNKFGADFQKAAVSLLTDNVFSFTQKVFQQIQLLSFIAIVIAIILYVIYFVLEQKSKQKAKKPLDAVVNATHNVSK